MKLQTTEHSIQTTFFKILDIQYKDIYPYIFAIPNGGKRDLITAKRLKDEGVKKGVSDVFVSIPSNGKSGLYIEFKRPKGIVTDFQKEFMERMLKNGYHCVVCFSPDEAIQEIKDYLNI